MVQNEARATATATPAVAVEFLSDFRNQKQNWLASLSLASDGGSDQPATAAPITPVGMAAATHETPLAAATRGLTTTNPSSSGGRSGFDRKTVAAEDFGEIRIRVTLCGFRVLFLWKGQVDGKGLSLNNWRTVITPKKFGGLGVRDPACDKSWVALLRAKYLRNEGVLDGPVPCNASQVWKSISKAFGALKDAFSWCVGSLYQSFWFDNWIIEGTIAQDVPFVHISDSDLTIRDVWKDDLNAGETLGWSWGVASSRLYSARSGYSWLAKRKFNWNEHDNWLWVWRLHIPEKYKFLIWLSLHNAIPTAEFRLGRGLALSRTCHRCQNDFESILHCLRECPSAKEIWNLLGLYSDNSDLCDWLYRGARSEDVFLFFLTIWWIWRSRNHDLFNIDDSWSASKVVSLIRSSVREFHTIFSMHQSLSPPSLCLYWVLPPIHSVKLNCDVSCFSPFGYAGFGCIIRNSDGCWLKGCTRKIEVCSVLFAELYAIWRGLFLTWDSGFREVICETDCLEALFLVNQRMLGKDIP
ncbi:uncharacterized protein LOC107606867 [Arachis ipaensis]|uniref:uncharacterized protein LOC107606867 n=1 Tax=Arachis ipaensis TaxID=130454 RepID=UPI0007AFBACD|nr:uncharacterized protein LOC107606867 [Arachis ipaensis]